MFLYGASGHGKVIAEIVEDLGLTVEGFIDQNIGKKNVLGYPIISSSAKGINGEAVISMGANDIRKKIVEDNPHLKYIKLVSPKSQVSWRAFIEEGTVIMQGVVVNNEVKIGKHCIINTNASVDHDCVLEDYVHVSPNVGLAGNVKVGEGTHIGIGANVIQGVRIGKWCTIGAGAVIIRDVPDGATVVGNPGRILPPKRGV